MTAEILAQDDDAVITTSSPHTDEVMMSDDEEPNDTHNEEFDEELTAPSTREVENSIEILKNFILFEFLGHFFLFIPFIRVCTPLLAHCIYICMT